MGVRDCFGQKGKRTKKSVKWEKESDKNGGERGREAEVKQSGGESERPSEKSTWARLGLQCCFTASCFCWVHCWKFN